MRSCKRADARQSRANPTPCPAPDPVLFSEGAAKTQLEAFGLRVPRAALAGSTKDIRSASAEVGFPQVLKGEGVAHKTEAGAVVLNLKTAAATQTAAEQMAATSFLIEEMITDAVVELLIGVVCDPAHGYVLTLAAGGTLTELWQDSTSLLLPVTDEDIEAAVLSLKIAPLLTGYRGADGVSISAVVKAVKAVQAYVLADPGGLAEIEINPLICTPTDAIAADALLRRTVERTLDD